MLFIWQPCRIKSVGSMDGSTRPVAVLNFPRERCPNLSDSCVNGQQCTVNVCLPLINDYRVLWISGSSSRNSWWIFKCLYVVLSNTRRIKFNEHSDVVSILTVFLFVRTKIQLQVVHISVFAQ